MDNGDGSSPTSSADGLLPLFIVRSMPADEGLEEKLGRAREDNRRLAATLGAILADHPHLRSLATPPAPDIAAAANVASRDQEILGVMAEPQPKIRTLSVRADPSASDSNLSAKDGYHWKKHGQPFYSHLAYQVVQYSTI